jgi:hypothetical protein
MFSVITNIYMKKTKGPTLMEFITEKLKKFFLTTRGVRCVHNLWNGTHRYDIQVLATHAATWVHRYSSLLQWFSHCLYHAWMVLSVGGSFAYFARNARCILTTDLLLWYSNTQNNFSPGAAIFSLHTLALPSGRNVNYDEKQLSGEIIFKLFLLSTGFVKYVSYGFPIINFCNPRIYYDTPGILRVLRLGYDSKVNHVQTLKVPGDWGSQVARQSAHEGCKVISLMQLSPLNPPPGIIPGAHFC